MKQFQYILSENVLRGKDEVIRCSGSGWEDRVYQEDEFEVKEEYVEPPEHIHCNRGGFRKVAVLKADICPHEPLIDTGVGYYYCPACDKGWSYNEWEAMEKGETDIWEEAKAQFYKQVPIVGESNYGALRMLEFLKSNYNITKK